MWRQVFPFWCWKEVHVCGRTHIYTRMHSHAQPSLINFKLSFDFLFHSLRINYLFRRKLSDFCKMISLSPCHSSLVGFDLRIICFIISTSRESRWKKKWVKEMVTLMISPFLHNLLSEQERKNESFRQWQKKSTLIHFV